MGPEMAVESILKFIGLTRKLRSPGSQARLIEQEHSAAALEMRAALSQLPPDQLIGIIADMGIQIGIYGDPEMDLTLGNELKSRGIR